MSYIKAKLNIGNSGSGVAKISDYVRTLNLALYSFFLNNECVWEDKGCKSMVY